VNSGHNLERLKEMAFEQLGVIRVYSKAPGKGADLNVPVVVKKGTTVEELAGKIHKDLLKHLKSARVWGSGAFDGQMVAREYVLQDNDIVELRA
jgi:ribosome-interacting GTPase 1